MHAPRTRLICGLTLLTLSPTVTLTFTLQEMSLFAEESEDACTLGAMAASPTEAWGSGWSKAWSNKSVQPTPFVGLAWSLAILGRALPFRLTPRTIGRLKIGLGTGEIMSAHE